MTHRTTAFDVRYDTTDPGSYFHVPADLLARYLAARPTSDEIAIVDVPDSDVSGAFFHERANSPRAMLDPFRFVTVRAELRRHRAALAIARTPVPVDDNERHWWQIRRK